MSSPARLATAAGRKAARRAPEGEAGERPAPGFDVERCLQLTFSVKTKSRSYIAPENAISVNPQAVI